MIHDPIDFYFDFISPYAYLASARVVQLAKTHGRALAWKPFRLGVVVVKVMGLPPVMQTPLKSKYIHRDVRRLARVLQVPFTGVDFEPQPLPPARALQAAPPEMTGTFAMAMLRAQWGEGRNLADTSVLVEVAGSLGIAERAVVHALENPATRDAITATTQEAIERGVFGSPTCVVGSELFWGVDRLWLLDEYLRADENFVALRPPPDTSISRIGAAMNEPAKGLNE